MPELRISPPAGFWDAEDKVLRISPRTKRLWAVEMDLLQAFDRVCARYGLSYFAVSGTLLGAVRHGGFIPWDDDIDVAMLRPDYERLLAVAGEAFEAPYFLQTDANSPEAARGHAQLRHSGTTAALRAEMVGGRLAFGFNQGVFMDVFPLDRIPDEPSARAVYFGELTRAKERVRGLKRAKMALRGFRGGERRLGLLWQTVRGVMLAIRERLTGKDLLAEANGRFARALRRYEGAETRQCASLALQSPPRRHEIFEIGDFARARRVPFEFLEIPVPFEAEKVLTGQFGDWREHVIGGASHEGMLVDLDRPYSEYAGVPGDGAR